MKKFEISVVIPAYNEEQYISRCLQSLVKQTTKQGFEVIVVDNNSTDDTKKIALSFKDKLNIRVITEKQQGRGAARWRGFEEATGEIIFSTDADTILPQNWISDYTKYFDNKKIVAVTSMSDIDDKSQKNRTIYKISHRLATEGSMVVLGHYCLYGFSFAIRKDIYVRAGKLDKTLNALDDLDLGKRVKNYGKIKLVRNMQIIVSNRRFKDGIWRGIVSFVVPVIKIILNKKKFVMEDYR